ncbi:spore coat protein [Brevibacillus choshinensis]|uniref:Spore coat protein n=2 Tax=Brevibacillus choshinensis TaxID=54911 RepID=A0ABR5N4X9_BRECH|nr:spore coat protein [Brevibacillus choshinensis]
MVRRKPYGWLLVAAAVALTGCAREIPSNGEAIPLSKKQLVQVQTPAEGLHENKAVYEQDEDGSIAHLYVTVVNEESSAFQTTTFSELSRSLNGMDEKGDDLKAKIIFQEGTADGPQSGYFGYGESRANGTIEIRGESSRSSQQKSFKIRLLETAGYWKEQRNINLNKHRPDITRVRQKLSFDYFEQMPNMTSLRTQFVHLMVKDMTGKDSNPKFVDYGLFTQIEQPNKIMLQAHGLDRNGNLYKAINFEFHRDEDKIKLANDPAYDKKAFESVMEIKGSENHEKLISMLDDLKNQTLPIKEVLDKHFDRDNYFTWLAANILMGNADTAAHNFYLYSPSDSDKWFFLPWDYDLSWGYFEEEAKRNDLYAIGKWEVGISNYWVSDLHRRVFKDPENVKVLNEKIEELSSFITKEKTKAMLDKYYPIASHYVKRQPDLYHLPQEVAKFDYEYGVIAGEPERNKARYYEKQENPMPFFMGDPETEQGKVLFSWDHSYDLQGDDLTYDFAIGNDPTLSKILIQVKGLTGTTYSVDKLAKGRYYWRVIARDSKGNEQTSFDSVNSDDLRYHGVREFVVK